MPSSAWTSKAYGVTINLKNDTVSLEAGTLINQLMESADRIPVRLRADCTLLTGHLNRCPVQVEGAALTGTFLFESAASSLGDASCQFEEQIVDVRDGLTDLFVERRGVGPSLKMCCGGVLGELRQLGATKVHIPRKREPVLCFPLYTLDPTLEKYPTTGTNEVVSESAWSQLGSWRIVTYVLPSPGSAWTVLQQPVKNTMLAFLAYLQMHAQVRVRPRTVRK